MHFFCGELQGGLYRFTVKFGMGRENPVHLSPYGKFFEDFLNRDMGPRNHGSASRIGGNKMIVHMCVSL